MTVHSRQWCAGASSSQLLLTLASVTSCWGLKTGYSGNIYTTEIGECYKSINVILLWPPLLLGELVYQHNTASRTRIWEPGGGKRGWEGEGSWQCSHPRLWGKGGTGVLEKMEKSRYPRGQRHSILPAFFSGDTYITPPYLL